MRSSAHTGEIEVLCTALLTTESAMASLLRAVGDASPTAVGVWSIGETAAHVSGSAASFLAAVRGLGPRERLDDLATSAADSLAQDPERDPGVLADRLERGETALVAYARGVEGDPVVEPFEGITVPLSTVLAVELGELLVHGFDIARAAGLPWSIPAERAVLVLDGYLPLLPHMVDPVRARGVRMAVELRIRGMDPVVIRVTDGAASVVETPGQRVDAHIATDPVSYLLLTWNRIPPWQPLLRGRLLVWGRRPWCALRLGEVMAT